MANEPTIIVIEGMDGSGKATQTHMLHEHLMLKKKKVVTASFPNYENVSSYPITEILKNDSIFDNGNLSYIKAIGFAIDRAMTMYRKSSKYLDMMQHKEGIIIMDRYTTSNILHVASEEQGEYRDELIDFIEDLEYNKIKLPIPDAVIFLDVSVDTSIDNIEKRNRCKDINENREHLTKVAERKNEIVKSKKWINIKCNDGNGILLSKEEIFDKILCALSSILDI